MVYREQHLICSILTTVMREKGVAQKEEITFSMRSHRILQKHRPLMIVLSMIMLLISSSFFYPRYLSSKKLFRSEYLESYENQPGMFLYKDIQTDEIHFLDSIDLC